MMPSRAHTLAHTHAQTHIHARIYLSIYVCAGARVDGLQCCGSCQTCRASLPHCRALPPIHYQDPMPCIITASSTLCRVRGKGRRRGYGGGEGAGGEGEERRERGRTAQRLFGIFALLEVGQLPLPLLVLVHSVEGVVEQVRELCSVDRRAGVCRVCEEGGWSGAEKTHTHTHTHACIFSLPLSLSLLSLLFSLLARARSLSLSLSRARSLSFSLAPSLARALSLSHLPVAGEAAALRPTKKGRLPLMSWTAVTIRGST
jgi:hypothetical protein